MVIASVFTCGWHNHAAHRGHSRPDAGYRTLLWRCGLSFLHFSHKDLQMFLFYPGAPGRALLHLYEKACKSTPRRNTLAGLRAPICSRRPSGPPPPAFQSSPPRTPKNQLCAKGGPWRPPPLPPRPPAAAVCAPRGKAVDARPSKPARAGSVSAQLRQRAPGAVHHAPQGWARGPHLKVHTSRPTLQGKVSTPSTG